MPIEKIIHLPSNGILILWDINETVSELQALFSQQENRFLQTGSSSKTEHKHWLASRLAILTMFPDTEIDLHKDELNKPFLKINKQNWNISLSHSFDKAAVLIHPNRLCGVDIERIDTRVNRVSSKFISDWEQEHVPDLQNTIVLTQIWSSKESIYKIWGKKGLDFKKNLRVCAIQSEHIMTQMILDDSSINISLNHLLLPDYIVTYGLLEMDAITA